MARRPVPSARISMRTIADRAGVSPMTVSYVLRGRTDLFRPETCERVQKVIAELGYVPSRSPRAMRTGRHGAVAFVASMAVAQDVSWYAQAMLDALLDEAAHHDLDLVYTRLAGSGDQPKLLRDANVDGLIVNAIAYLDPDLLARLARRYPLVRANEVGDVDAVRPDEVGAGTLAAQELLARGCHRLAYVQFWRDGGHYCFADRRRGFSAAAERAGQPVAVMPIPATAQLSYSECVRAAIDFVASQRPDGICCLGQREAVAIAEGLAQHGVQAQLIAFGEAIVQVGTRSIPTVITPYAEVGRQAMTMLLAKIAKPGPRPAIEVPTVEVRGSGTGH